MSVYDLAAFSAAMFLLAVTPGPGVFITVSKALASGFKASLPVIAGIVSGDLVFLLAAIYGLAAVAEVFAALFVVIKYAGAAYLIWLGMQLWRSPPKQVRVAASKKYGFLSGLSITLGNPKVILFYLGFLPAFVDLHALESVEVLLIVLALTSILGSVMLFYAFSAARTGMLFKSGRSQQQLKRMAGSVMIGTGTVLIAKA
ncbi:LysE family translocator [Sulfurimonas sp. HSL-3221]|uniref:LysE family translocator n=1 Tax=Sulfurimonadaceae TaxID=2771471 RepID=UPI001E5EE00B|nr:LysE family translocator [Sulfurimonas sp. HSL-3221]UFS63466.1 LysE family translocator [Sulfurimonas sp. HSL-3221]